MKEQEYTQYDTKSNIKRIEQEFLKSEGGRLNALLSPFRIGPIAVTQLLLLYNHYITPSELTRRFREVFEGTEVASFYRNAVLGYCMKTLYPNGLVAQKVTIDFGKEKLVGLGHTEAGRKYGIPAACLFIYVEQQHNQSFYPVFGSINVNSPDQDRAPYNRARILLFLNNRPKLQKADVCKQLGIGEATARINLKALAKAGAIDYEAVTPHSGETQVTYTKGELPASGVIRHKGGSPTFKQEVIRCCEELIEEQEAIAQEAIFRKLPQEIRDRYKNEHGLRSLINQAVLDLSDQGYLLRGKFRGKEVQSVVQISQRGKAIVSDFLGPLIRLIQDDNATKVWLGEEVVPNVTENLRLYAKNTAELYYPHSKSFKVKHTGENIDRLQTILSVSSTMLATGQLCELTGLNSRTLNDYLNLLIIAGLAQREKRRGVYYYGMKDTE